MLSDLQKKGEGINFFLKAIFFLLVVGSAGAFEKQVVFLYDGPGISQESLIQTERSMQKALPTYQIKHITPLQVVSDSWEEEAALFILPGGADLPYVASLEGDGNRKIRDYVEGGGSFLGICAGSYYAGNFVDFALGTDMEVQGERKLSFFPGIVRGPILAPYDYLSNSGAVAAKLQWADSKGLQAGEEVAVFYNGGGYFVDASKHSQITTLAYYDEGYSLPAIIECSVGMGKAILSGPHFEYDPSTLDAKDCHLEKLLPELIKDNESRIALLEHLLSRLIN